MSLVRMRLAHGCSSEASDSGRQTKIRLPARRFAGAFRRRMRADDRDLVDGRLHAGMAVDVVVRLEGLAVGFEQSPGPLEERHADLVWTGRHRHARPQVLVDRAVVADVFRRHDFEQAYPLAVEQELELMRLPQALYLLVAVAHQPDDDLVFGVEREGVGESQAAARTQRQAVDIRLLGDVRLHLDLFRR